MMNIQKNIPNPIKIKINYENKIYETSEYLSTNASELRQKVFSKLNIDDSHILSYKNKKISREDSSDLSILFDKDQNPLLFVNDKYTILPSIKPSSSITINTNIPQQKLLNILNLFFQSKYLPFNASIKSPMKGTYTIKFSKPNLAKEFLNYYNEKLYKKINSLKNISLSLRTKNSTSIKKIPKISIKNNNKIFPSIKINNNVKKTSSMSDIVFKNDKNLALYNVIKKNTKDDKISHYSISLGINKYHPSYIHYIKQSESSRFTKKRNDYINEKYVNDDVVYKGAYSFPFMSEEEKYMKENFLDKQNWLDKKGFLLSVGKYKMKENFIPNYVNATPSESPLNYKFREVKKMKWLNKNGFYP